jgi:NAD(P)-dependent dehydrogenase (short-subunit alcohol dehydrogenase family)
MGTGSAVAPAYSASKFAIRGLTQAAGISRLLRLLSVVDGSVDDVFLKHPISVNTVLP